ncbi:hypothetical protein ElyMa_002025900 [Elysia marginata]|uniref:Uncharacterized protein n=1 Tax=Elysia marginata TaxID=1093978 RepID=A0AAV4F724_9GAST|nr:hypothetical protein ElyMa_002025900 [Elysia marginata]
MGGMWPGAPPTDTKNGLLASPTAFHERGMDAEDLRERMGLDEEEEGRGQPYGGGRGVYEGRFGAGEEGDEREWGGDKRRRRRSQAFVQGFHPHRRHSPTSLSGTLTCSQTSMIHVFNVTVGYSNTAYCYPTKNRSKQNQTPNTLSPKGGRLFGMSLLSTSPQPFTQVTPCMTVLCLTRQGTGCGEAGIRHGGSCTPHDWTWG